MALDKIIDLLKDAIPTVKLLGDDRGNFIVHKRIEAEINGVHGFLIWDYLIWNEISFDADNGETYSFFTSFSDKKTKHVWKKLKKIYGINVNQKF